MSRLGGEFFLASSTISGTVGQVGIYDGGPRIWEMTRAYELAGKNCRAKATPQRHAQEPSTREACDPIIKRYRALTAPT
jgi:hypothetical protein